MFKSTPRSVCTPADEVKPFFESLILFCPCLSVFFILTQISDYHQVFVRQRLLIVASIVLLFLHYKDILFQPVWREGILRGTTNLFSVHMT